MDGVNELGTDRAMRRTTTRPLGTNEELVRWDDPSHKKIFLHPFPHTPFPSNLPLKEPAEQVTVLRIHIHSLHGFKSLMIDHFISILVILPEQFWFFSTNNSDPFTRTILILLPEQFWSFSTNYSCPFTRTILVLLAEQFWTFFALLPRQSCWLCYMDNPSTFTWTILAPLPGQFWLRFLDNSSSNTWSILTLTWVNSGIYTNNLGPLTWTILVPLP